VLQLGVKSRERDHAAAEIVSEAVAFLPEHARGRTGEGEGDRQAGSTVKGLVASVWVSRVVWCMRLAGRVRLVLFRCGGSASPVRSFAETGKEGAQGEG
jgi:hypothetical protein